MDFKALCQFRKEWHGKLILVMKLTTALILIVSLQVAAKGYTQESITLSEKNATLKEIFNKIERQTDYFFVYRTERLKQAKNVSIEVRSATVQEVLNIVFKDQPLSYEIVGKTVVIKPRDDEENKNKLLQATPLIDVKGKVTNEKGEPLEGVTVAVKGTKIATSTNSNGEFTLNNVDKDAILLFTHISMETFELKLEGKQEVAIALKTKIGSLADIQIMANTGFQIIKPNEATGSVVVINEEQLDQRVASDIISKLEGITNGLVFNKKIDGTNAIRIRGESTIYANPNPLVVVDNFPYDGNINSINPNDIENITILKDAAAASIWGVQAANGVIVITTKRGRLNQPLKVELNANVTVGGKPNLFYSPRISSSAYVDFEQFLFDQAYFDSYLFNPSLPAVSPVVEILNDKFNGVITEADATEKINAYRNVDQLRDDFLKYIYQKPILQQYQVNISGGANKLGYYFSTGYDRNLSNAKGNNDYRITLNNQLTFKLLKNLDFSAGLSYVEGRSNNNSIVNNLPSQNLYPYTRLSDEGGSPLSVPFRRQMFEDTIGTHGFLDWKYYPLKEQEYNDSKNKNYETRLQAGLKYAIVKGLNAEFLYQFQRVTNQGENYTSPKSYFIRDQYNTFAILDNDNNFIGSNYNNNLLNRGLLDVSNSVLTGHHGRFTLNYQNSWKDHAVSGMAGIEVTETKVEGNTNRFWGYDKTTGSFVSPDLFTYYPTYPSFDLSQISRPGSGVTTSGILSRFRSYFGIVNYTYRNRYSASVSARFDGTNYFGVKTNKKTVPLWSAGLKWDISKESFYKVDWLSNLNLKITYGYNGNLAQNLAAMTTIKYADYNSQYSNLKFSTINNIPNPNLGWEKTGQLNVGLNFALKKERVTGSIEYYRKNGEDLIGDAPVDPTTGITQIRGNFSGLESKGIDVQLTAKFIDTKIKWVTNFIFNYAMEKVTRYDIPLGALSYLVAYSDIYPKVGSSLYSLYSYRWAGLDPATGDPRVYRNGAVTSDYTQLSSFKDQDLIYNGRYNPPVFGSLYNNFSWKGLSLSVNLVYKFHYFFRRSAINYSAFGNGYASLHSDFADRWRNPGDESRTDVPSLTYPLDANRDHFYSNSTALIEKGDHIRLQFINLSYTLGNKILDRIGVSSMQLYLYANNMGIIWRANGKGIDPDYPYTSFPPAKTYSVGLKLSFK
jgi:TonB-dependent starch-binding outer membrane protein SusC